MKKLSAGQHARIIHRFLGPCDSSPYSGRCNGLTYLRCGEKSKEYYDFKGDLEFLNDKRKI